MGHAIIFDMDGVLVDSEPVIEAAAIAGLAEYDVFAKPEDFIPFIGSGEDRYIGSVAEKYGLPYRSEIKKRAYQIYLEMVPSKLKVFPGALELLQNWYREGIPMALASSADRIKIDANLKAAFIPSTIFNVIISGEEVVRKKPSPDIYLLAAERLGLSPEQCIVIEDALNGIRAAKAAGMKCLAVASSFTEQELTLENPDFICETITEADTILQEFCK